MRIGIQTFFDGQQREPLNDYVAGVSRILEERGFGAVWMSEHVVTFRDYDPAYPYPYADDGRPPAFLSEFGMLDPMSALTAIACHSSTLRLCTGIAILPQRNPVYFAKMGTAIDLLSGGRFVAGIGLGWSAQEFAATNTPFAHRGARADEYVEVLKSLWRNEEKAFEGEHYTMPACIQLPLPAQHPHPPLYFGGESRPALRRVARHGQGWVGFRTLPDALASRLAILRELLDEEGRTLNDIDIVISPGEHACDADMLARYAELGASEVVVICFDRDLDGFTRQADHLARTLVEPAARL
ncbi:hypothetical protein K663_17886 [Sphingobium sp. MI1205]|nr:hypothetical protein K663_17886 [Sphingobium sp. MI1205]